MLCGYEPALSARMKQSIGTGAPDGSGAGAAQSPVTTIEFQPGSAGRRLLERPGAHVANRLEADLAVDAV
jgi:hypothetical protein